MTHNLSLRIRITAALLALLLVTGLCPIALADGESQPSAMVQVVYASPQGNFAFERVNVSPQNNVVSPNASLVPAGYVGVNTNPVPLIFNQAGSPIPSVIYFTYQLAPVATPVPTTPPVQAPSGNQWQFTTGWQVPGHVLVFGQYEQDNNLHNGKEPVEWVVLKVEGARALLISRYALDTRPYDDEWKKVSWKDCDMRSWLNSVFYNECFTDRQKQAVLFTSNQTNYVNKTVDTQDYVFTLSVSECEKYLTKPMRMCVPSSYAQSQGAALKDGYCYWWLRDTTNRKNDANRVEPNGDTLEYGSNTNAQGVAIRPVVWINLPLAFGS